MSGILPPTVDVDRLRAEVKLKYREVATTPGKGLHFHTSRPLAAMLGYPMDFVDALPAPVVESFAGVNNPFSMGDLREGGIVVDVGSAGGSTIADVVVQKPVPADAKADDLWTG